MKIHLTNGLEAEIDEAEAERIAGELAMLHGAVETNEAFTNRALDNIEHMTGFRPKSEAETVLAAVRIQDKAQQKEAL